MPDANSGWELEGFFERIDAWEEIQDPATVPDLRYHIFNWLLGRAEDPYQGVARQPGFDNLWQGFIPRTHHRKCVVVGSYFIFERDRRIVCNSIATLGWPVT